MEGSRTSGTRRGRVSGRDDKKRRKVVARPSGLKSGDAGNVRRRTGSKKSVRWKGAEPVEPAEGECMSRGEKWMPKEVKGKVVSEETRC